MRSGLVIPLAGCAVWGLNRGGGGVAWARYHVTSLALALVIGLIQHLTVVGFG